MEDWSKRHFGNWKQYREDVLHANAKMIDQYCNFDESRSAKEISILLNENWNVIREFVSADRITTSARPFQSDEIECMLVTTHCLCMMMWDKAYNKFYPEFDEDVIADVGAAEASVDVLERFDLMTRTHRGGKWTPEGIDMLNGKLR